MSQAQLLPAASTPSSLPPITYKGLPVVTTEMLAKAYGCSVKNIRDNFANNRERFTEGKHFYALTNGEVKAFRDCTESFGAVVPARTRNLTLWLERGAARHAKMLNTDQAWDVFEMLEETFFRVVKPEPAALTQSTADDRKPLRSLVHAWAHIAGVSHQALWPQVKAHFQLARIDDLPVEWIGDALAFVQGKIDGHPKALPESKPLRARTLDYRTHAEVKARLARIFHELAAARDQITDCLENIDRRVMDAFNNPQRRGNVATSADITIRHFRRSLAYMKTSIEDQASSCGESLLGLIELSAVLEDPQASGKAVMYGVQTF